MNNLMVKKLSKNISEELQSVGFDSSYVSVAKDKYKGFGYKIFNLKPHEANILKQLCLSLGFDCAVSRETVMCSCEYTDAVIYASLSQINKLRKKLLIQPFRLKQLSDLFNIKQKKYTRPKIMGILNVTPDSFSDGGKYFDVSSALIHAKKLVDDGADIIDVGGESTRPDFVSVDVNDEIDRVIPVIKAMRENGITCDISVDTRNYETAKKAVEFGANIINDISGLEDVRLFNYVKDNNIKVVIVHSKELPADKDIVDEIYSYFYEKINSGLNKENIIVDVGIGFNKTIEQNIELLKRLDEFETLGVPMLLGISRKSFIRNSFNIDCDEADIPTALYSSMINCVDIHRVHNVSLTKRYLDFSFLIRD